MSATDSVSEVARLRARLEKEYEALYPHCGVYMLTFTPSWCYAECSITV